MDSTSPVAARSADTPTVDSDTSRKQFFATAAFTLVEYRPAGRGWLDGEEGHQRSRDCHSRSAGGDGRAG